MAWPVQGIQKITAQALLGEPLPHPAGLCGKDTALAGVAEQPVQRTDPIQRFHSASA